MGFFDFLTEEIAIDLGTAKHANHSQRQGGGGQPIYRGHGPVEQ